MATWRQLVGRLLAAMLIFGMPLAAQGQPTGSVRGVVHDEDFGTPIGGVQVLAVETGLRATTTDQGQFVLGPLPTGRYTLVFSRDGYGRVVLPDVVVVAGQLTDLAVTLTGEITEMDEFVVQDLLQFGAGTEAALLGLRFESSSLMDSISADLISRAGASDAAGALTLVSGATVQDGKFAVIRGLPDRYVSSQVNGVRLPSADEDTRAVELDQFPVAVIESIQVSKTFTPDQQGDASGGAVDVRLKTIPDETIFEVKTQVSANSQVFGEDDFLSSKGGGVHYFGDKTGKGIQYDNIGDDWTGAVGTTTEDAPYDYKMSGTAGGKIELDNGFTLGGLASVFYERDSAYYDDGVNDSWFVEEIGGGLVPKTNQGSSSDGNFKTALYDVTQGTQTENWGGLGTLGLENENHAFGLTYLYTESNEDKATLATDTRGKEYFFPGYDPYDVDDPGNQDNTVDSAPYLRTETLEYSERKSDTLQLNGRHTLPETDWSLGPFDFGAPEVDWTLSDSSASLNQPDKRQFGALWIPETFDPGNPVFGIPPSIDPATWFPYKPGANFNFGNVQRIFKKIDEESKQGSLNVKLPFTQWDGHEGYLKVGAFQDEVDRTFDQETFSNFGDFSEFDGDFVDDPWSGVFPGEDGHDIFESLEDVDYKGKQKITAQYGMVDMPLNSWLNFIGGARFESTKIDIVNDPEALANWFPPGSLTPVALNPGDADVSYEQDDVLPSLGFIAQLSDEVTLRGSYSETVARQTFKELTPVIQQEFLGGPIFIGNPDLEMAALENHDLRVDWVPQEGELFSVSWFNKDIDDPIENVQQLALFDYTTAVNYPEGNLNGFELEVRQALGNTWEDLTGLSVGANATFIDSEVTLPADEAATFDAQEVPLSKRDATGAPEHLYNLYATYDVEHTGTQFAVFYTIKGDTLVAGAGATGGTFVPNVYEKEYGTLNLSISQQVGERARLQFQAKNLTDSPIEQVYRSDYIDGDVTKTSYTRGREYSLGLSVRF